LCDLQSLTRCDSPHFRVVPQRSSSTQISRTLFDISWPHKVQRACTVGTRGSQRGWIVESWSLSSQFPYTLLSPCSHPALTLLSPSSHSLLALLSLSCHSPLALLSLSSRTALTLPSLSSHTALTLLSLSSHTVPTLLTLLTVLTGVIGLGGAVLGDGGECRVRYRIPVLCSCTLLQCSASVLCFRALTVFSLCCHCALTMLSPRPHCVPTVPSRYFHHALTVLLMCSGCAITVL
jgi:hypothetical protein